MPIGLSLTAAAGIETFDDDEVDGVEIEDETFVFGKIGYEQSFFEIGSTAFSIDAFYGEDAYFDTDVTAITTGDGDNAEAVSFGVSVVQTIDPLSADIYAGARIYNIELPGDSPAVAAGTDADPDDLLAVMSGVRVQF